MAGPLVKAIYEFQQEADTDLQLNVGDIIKITQIINDEWYEGICQDRKGQFPSGFVEIIFNSAPDRVAVATSDFSGEQEGDLSFKKGTVIAIEDDIDDNWATGFTKQSHGIFPKGFIRELCFGSFEVNDFNQNEIADSTALGLRGKQNGLDCSPCGEAIQEFSAQDEDELSFPKGAKIELTKEIDSFWTEGIYEGKTGKFPSAFIDIIRPLPEILQYRGLTETQEEKDDEALPKAKALYMYVGSGKDDLSFDKGDVIMLKERINKEWLKGQIGNSVGLFPANYVKIIVDFPFQEIRYDIPDEDFDILDRGYSSRNEKSPDTPNGGTLLKEANSAENKKPERTAKPFLSSQTTSKTQSITMIGISGSTAVKVPSKKPGLQPKPKLSAKPVLPVKNKPTLSTPPNRNSIKKTDISSERPDKRNVVNNVSNGPTLVSYTDSSNLKRSNSTRNSFNSTKPIPVTKIKTEPVQSNFISMEIASKPDSKPTPLRPNSIKIDSAKPVPTVPEIAKLSPNSAKSLAPKRPSRPTKRPAPKPPVQKPAVTEPQQKERSASPSQKQETQSSNTPLQGPSTVSIFDCPPSQKLPKPLAPQRPNVQPNSPTKNLLQKPDNKRYSSSTLPRNFNVGSFQSYVDPPLLKENADTSLRFSKDDTEITFDDYLKSQSSLKRSHTMSSKRSSIFYLENTSETSGSELEKVESEIGEIKRKIESETTMLSGIETLLEFSTDDDKKSDLLFRQRVLSKSIDDLNDELKGFEVLKEVQHGTAKVYGSQNGFLSPDVQEPVNSLADEKSYLLASYGNVEDIKNRISQLEDHIKSYQENSEKLHRLQEFATVEELTEIRDGIEFCDNMVETLQEEMRSLKEKLEEKQAPSKEDPGEIRRKLLENREKVLEELMNTERDYVRNIEICTKVLMPKLKESKDIDCSTLFGNLAEVFDVADQLLVSMENVLNEENDQYMMLGKCFEDLADSLRTTYATYCRNYDDSQALLEKYEQDSDLREEILAAVHSVRDQTHLWDLPSFLIKPVQRILKYPLMLQELYKSTPDDDPCRESLLSSINTLTDIATAINELKRRKDLVQKYTQVGALPGKMQRLNWHSVRKKSSRINTKITQFTGFKSQTIDERFMEAERRFRNVEKSIKLFIKNISLYLESFQESSSLHRQTADNIRDFYNEQAACEEIDSYHNVMLKMGDVLCFHFVEFVKSRVLDPLNQLLLLFQSPFRLIEKRQDKCLDYDSLLNRVQRIKERDKLKQVNEELLAARNNYEALNAQLIEDLPKLTQKCIALFRYCLANLVQAQKSYLQKLTREMQSLLKLEIVSKDRNDILERHNELVHRASEKLSELLFYPERAPPLDVSKRPEAKDSPTPATTNFYVDLLWGEAVPGKDLPSPMKPIAFDEMIDNESDSEKPVPLPRRKSLRRSSSAAASPTISPGNPGSPVHSYNTNQALVSPTRATRASPTSAFFELYVTDYTFEGADPSEITVREGTIVNVLQKYDKSGNPEWWLVETENAKGYIPESYLTPFKEQDRSSTESISSLCGSPVKVTEKSIIQSQRSSKQESVVEMYLAQYDFEASNPGELDMIAGDSLKVIQKHDQSDNAEWWLVERNGRTGYVPAAYLSHML